MNPGEKAQRFVSGHRRFSVAISTSCSVYACCSGLSPGSCHLQTSQLRFCILALRSDARRQLVRHLSGVRKSFTRDKRRATGSCAAYNIVFFGVVRRQAAFPKVASRCSGAFTDANAVPWSLGGGREETRVFISLPMQSTSPVLSMPHQEKMGEICCISRGGACGTPTMPPPTYNL